MSNIKKAIIGFLKKCYTEIGALVLVFVACIAVYSGAVSLAAAFGDNSKTSPESEDFGTGLAAINNEYNQDLAVSGFSESKIGAETKIIYEYYYQADGQIDKIEEMAPYFLIGLTRQEAQEHLGEWSIMSFSPSEIVLRKSIEGQISQCFIVGEQNGLVAVFYSNGEQENGLREVTETLVSTLPEEEQERLKEGIPVTGLENLFKLLQDFDS